MANFPSENQWNQRGLDLAYQLEDIGILEFSPSKVEGEMQMCIKPNIDYCREWIISRTINGEKLTKKKTALVDRFIFVFMTSNLVDENGNKIDFLRDTLKIEQTPQLLKWYKKQREKYLRGVI